MEAKTFVLTDKKTWRRSVRVFVMNQNKKFEERLLPFTTEHRVPSKQRTSLGRKTSAEYVTDDPIIIEALYRDTAYGKNFIQRGDQDIRLKKPTLIINDKDREVVALRGLFKAVGLTFDETLPYDVLAKQYEIHMKAVSGKKTDNQPMEIPYTPINVKSTIAQGVINARQKYEDEYGDPVPEIVKNDLAFLDGLSVPGFDSQKYIEAKMAKDKKVSEGVLGGDELKPENKETLHKAFFAKFSKNVPNMKSNELGWIKAKLAE